MRRSHAEPWRPSGRLDIRVTIWSVQLLMLTMDSGPGKVGNDSNSGGEKRTDSAFNTATPSPPFLPPSSLPSLPLSLPPPSFLPSLSLLPPHQTVEWVLVLTPTMSTVSSPISCWVTRSTCTGLIRYLLFLITSYSYLSFHCYIHHQNIYSLISLPPPLLPLPHFPLPPPSSPFSSPPSPFPLSPLSPLSITSPLPPSSFPALYCHKEVHL